MTWYDVHLYSPWENVRNCFVFFYISFSVQTIGQLHIFVVNTKKTIILKLWRTQKYFINIAVNYIRCIFAGSKYFAIAHVSNIESREDFYPYDPRQHTKYQERKKRKSTDNRVRTLSNWWKQRYCKKCTGFTIIDINDTFS